MNGKVGKESLDWVAMESLSSGVRMDMKGK